MTTDKRPRSRRKTPAPGDALKTAILDRYSLDPAERLLLEQAAALANVLDRLNREVAAQETFVAEGSRGQPTVSALLDAQRRHAETLARLLAALALPEPGEEQGETLATRRARAAAQARWAKQKKGVG